MTDRKDHRRRLEAKKDVRTLSLSATNTYTYTTPDLREMVHGFDTGRDVRRTLHR